MTPEQATSKLTELMSLPAECEWVEFKEARNNLDSDDLGKYFSALSNEANLKDTECGWLVLGVRDRPRSIVGTRYRSSRPSLDSLKREVATHTSQRITFDEIYEVTTPSGRVLLFRIPCALPGVPTAWKGHYYGRDGESLGPLNPHEQDQIRRQTRLDDWSARICDDASVENLDLRATSLARRQYREKHPHIAEEIDGWDDTTFLNKAKVCVDGNVTHAALLLLGKEQSAHLLTPATPQITWVLRDADGMELDYRHFFTPFMLAVDQVLGRIRNLTIRQLPAGTLFPVELSQYDPWVLREVLHNCIAHQDYQLKGRVNVVENPDSLVFTNVGDFLPGSVEDVIRRDAPPEEYRNPFLAQAMVNLNMIDTIGSGIKRMFQRQRQRFFPLPDYDLSEPARVKVRLLGKVIDENYTRLLIQKSNLNLFDVIALDKVQKKCPLEPEEFKRLKAQKLVEGRRPNLYVSAKIADLTGERAAYIHFRAFDKDHYTKMVVTYLEQWGEAKREDIDNLLIPKLSDALTDEQKKTFVTNLLQEMKASGLIEHQGVTRWGKWVLTPRSG